LHKFSLYRSVLSAFFEHVKKVIQNVWELTRPKMEENIVTAKSWCSYKTRLFSFTLRDEGWISSTGKI